jgi:hypothetical protein
MSEPIGTVVGLWRYPVKSMIGEEVNASDVTERGLLGDREFALVDADTGKVVSAKNPRKWARIFDFRAAFVEPPSSGGALPAVRITFPDGSFAMSDDADLSRRVSDVLGRKAEFRAAGLKQPSLEEYWPDMEDLDHRDVVTDEAMPPGTFFDAASVLVLTTATLDGLREAYPQGRFEVRRFRPNVVVQAAGATGFVENNWVGGTLALGGEVRLKIVKPCPRCVMTTLPQGDLPRDSGILRTAAQQNKVNVGVYASVERGGRVRRHDEVNLM